MRTSRAYTKELKRQFDYFATWLPSTPLALGDIGILKQNAFTKIANLSDYGIAFEIEKDPTPSNLEYSSKGAVSITLKASGSAAPEGSSLAKADAGVSIEFSKENAIYFKANHTTSPAIQNQIELGNQIIELYKKGEWNKEWLVITELVNAESGTILIANSSEGKIELKANAEVEVSNLDLADASLQLGLTYSKDVSTSIIAEKALTPLFKASKIKDNIFQKPSFSIKSVQPMELITPSMARNEKDVVVFGEADFEDSEEG